MGMILFISGVDVGIKRAPADEMGKSDSAALERGPVNPPVLTTGGLREPAIYPCVPRGIGVIGKSKKRDSAPRGSWWTDALA